MALAALGYISAIGGFCLNLIRSHGSPKAASFARAMMGFAVLVHGSYIVHYAFSQHVCPVRTINLGVSTGALIATLVYVAIRKTFKIQGFGVIVAPIALTFLLAGRFVAAQEVPAELTSRTLPLHIAANSVGVVLFMLSSAAAALYLLQQRLLKAKRGISSLGRLPALSALDSASHGFLLFGYPFMTIGMVTGTLWVSKLSHGLPAEYVRVLMGYVSWAVFSAVLILRIRGWQGRRAALGTLTGFVLAAILVALYLSNLGGR
jgi:ABC-type uncharacterized transport system permease subunit